MFIIPPVLVQGDRLVPNPVLHSPLIVGNRPPGFDTPERPRLEVSKSVVGE
jgi:hypothetical protein